MAMNENRMSFKVLQTYKGYVYAPLLFFTGLKTLAHLRNNYKIEKK